MVSIRCLRADGLFWWTKTRPASGATSRSRTRARSAGRAAPATTARTRTGAMRVGVLPRAGQVIPDERGHGLHPEGEHALVHVEVFRVDHGRDSLGLVPHPHLYIEAGDAVGQGGEVLRPHLRLDLLRLGRAVDALEAGHGRAGEGGVVHGG